MISIVCEGIGKEPMNVLNENKSYDLKKRIQYPTLVSQERYEWMNEVLTTAKLIRNLWAVSLNMISKIIMSV